MNTSTSIFINKTRSNYFSAMYLQETGKALYNLKKNNNKKKENRRTSYSSEV